MSIQTPLVKDLMTSNPVVLFKDSYLVNAADVMIKYKVSLIPVIERNTGYLLGIISEKEVMQELTLDSYARFFYEATLEKVIKINPITIELDLNLFDAESIFQKNNISHAPVVEGQKVVGVIARRDLIRGALNLLNTKEKTAQEIQKQRAFKPATITDYYHVINSRSNFSFRDENNQSKQ